MKKAVFSILLASLGFMPSAAIAEGDEQIYLIGVGGTNWSIHGGPFVIPMNSMEQCQAAGLKLQENKNIRSVKNKYAIGFDCITGGRVK